MVFPKRKAKVINRKLETSGLIRARANHVDNRIVSLVTFLPFQVERGKHHIEAENTTYEDLPVIIFKDNRKIWFNFIENPDSVFIIGAKKYQIMGYPQPTKTMLSLDMMIKIFGKKPNPIRPMPLSKLQKINPEQLLRDINKFIKRYVGFFDPKGKIKSDLYWMVAYWIMQTYVYDVWSKASYLKIMGVHATGKSTLSKLIELLSFCSERSTAKISDSWFYRNLHCVGGVQCLDEMELNPRDSWQFLNLLKAGTTQDSMVHLSDKNDPNKSEFFNVYSPKVLSGTEVQNIDPVLSSRMIEITMRGAPSKYNYSSDDIYGEQVEEEARKLRDQLYIFRLLHAHDFYRHKALSYKDKTHGKLDAKGKETLKNRQLDVYAPLLSMSDHYGGKIMRSSLQRAIQEQVDIKKSEFFETFDLPIIKVLYEATRKVDKKWLSARVISDVIIHERAGSDSIRRRFVTARYDADIVERHLKGLGISRNTKYSLSGNQYLFHKDDVERYIKGRGIVPVSETAYDPKLTQIIVDTIYKYQMEVSGFSTKGVPLSVLIEELQFNPHIHLICMLNEPNPKVKETYDNRWLVIET